MTTQLRKFDINYLADTGFINKENFYNIGQYEDSNLRVTTLDSSLFKPLGYSKFDINYDEPDATAPILGREGLKAYVSPSERTPNFIKGREPNRSNVTTYAGPICREKLTQGSLLDILPFMDNPDSFTSFYETGNDTKQYIPTTKGDISYDSLYGQKNMSPLADIHDNNDLSSAALNLVTPIKKSMGIPGKLLVLAAVGFTLAELL